MKNLAHAAGERLNTTGGRISAAALAVVTVLGIASPSFATSLDPTTDVTTFATSAISQLYPIVLAVAGAMVALLVLRWGVKKVLSVLKGRATV
jgi:hypothetical protein